MLRFFLKRVPVRFFIFAGMVFHPIADALTRLNYANVELAILVDFTVADKLHRLWQTALANTALFDENLKSKIEESKIGEFFLNPLCVGGVIQYRKTKL